MLLKKIRFIWAVAYFFRHPAAAGTSHLLQANYEIRTILRLLGHSAVSTTMIYTHAFQAGL